MKIQRLILPALFIAVYTHAKEETNNNIAIKAEQAVSNISKKSIPVRQQEKTSLQPGEILNLSDFTKMPNGIMFKTIKKGSGNKPVAGETLTVHYSGYLLIDGKKVGLKFDSSLDRNSPFNFKLSARMVIAGWETSLADMKVGETRIVILPSSQAYGKRATASIPADSTLIFEISLLKAS